MNLAGLKVVVVGIARSGLSAALFLKSKGATVYATDSGDSQEVRGNAEKLKNHGIDVETGGHTEFFVKGKELMVVSPGVDSSSEVIGWGKKYGLHIISEMELGYLFCKGRIIAVTGTNGKSTTTELIGNIIRESGLPVVVCGNIGNPFTNEIENITPSHFVVLEVSSFQLEWVEKFKPYISIILNITDDHLDRHKGFAEYANLKKKIYMNQDKADLLILNHEDPNLRGLDKNVSPKVLYFNREKTKDIHPPHNPDNIMASVWACRIIGIGQAHINRGISSFSALPHRFQTVAEVDGIEFIDDSKATNVDATLKALLSLERSVVLIAGGRDKEGNFSLIRDVVRQKVRELVLIGEAREKIKSFMNGVTSIHEAGSLEEAVELAARIAHKGEAVLLSPMCSSFDMFKDYAERGEVFIKAVKNLKRQETRHCEVPKAPKQSLY